MARPRKKLKSKYVIFYKKEGEPNPIKSELSIYTYPQHLIVSARTAREAELENYEKMLNKGYVIYHIRLYDDSREGAIADGIKI